MITALTIVALMTITGVLPLFGMVVRDMLSPAD